MYCARCGRKLSDGVTVCPVCGQLSAPENAPAVPVYVVAPPKSRIVYVMLAWLLGGFGVHNFYAGRMTVAVIQLVMTLLGCFLPVVWIWVVFDCFLVTADGSGRRMTGSTVVSVVLAIFVALSSLAVLTLAAAWIAAVRSAMV